MKKTIKFNDQLIEIEYRLLSRKDRRVLAGMGINLPDFGVENFPKLCDYILANCITSEISEDAPIGVDMLIANAVIESSYSPSGDEAKN
jgi:hypothetical protein